MMATTEKNPNFVSKNFIDNSFCSFDDDERETQLYGDITQKFSKLSNETVQELKEYAKTTKYKPLCLVEIRRFLFCVLDEKLDFLSKPEFELFLKNTIFNPDDNNRITFKILNKYHIIDYLEEMTNYGCDFLETEANLQEIVCQVMTMEWLYVRSKNN